MFYLLNTNFLPNRGLSEPFATLLLLPFEEFEEFEEFHDFTLLVSVGTAALEGAKVELSVSCGWGWLERMLEECLEVLTRLQLMFSWLILGGED